MADNSSRIFRLKGSRSRWRLVGPKEGFCGLDFRMGAPYAYFYAEAKEPVERGNG